MKHEDKMARDLARLEEVRRRTQDRLAIQQDRIDKRFERMREQLTKKYGVPSESQQRIIEAALELLREDGLNNLSLRKLAKRVDMQASALYWHFKSKEELVDYMAEAILQREFEDIQFRRDDETWQDWLTEQMLKLRKAMLAFPDGGRVVAGAHLFPAVTLARFSEVTLHSLCGAGLSLQESFDIGLTATHYTFGHVIEEQASPTLEQIGQSDISAFLVPYPILAEAIEAGDIRKIDPEELFRKGLRYIIAGATALGTS